MLFADNVTALSTPGTGVLELGPDGVLSALFTETPAAAAMRRERPEVQTLLNSVGHIWRWGLKVDWPAVFKNTGARQTDLPTYAFQHRPYWLSLTPRAADLGHPLLAALAEVPLTGTLVLTVHLDAGEQPWLADHRV
ncbi:hypothetical protein ACUJ8K_35230, partial [Streptomyces sp. ESS7.8]|uniref:hypothetical protein n=1 Tax=Streptomyces sp. ESS7.8 TaxID=3461013 RepID=UPI0040415899